MSSSDRLDIQLTDKQRAFRTRFASTAMCLVLLLFAGVSLATYDAPRMVATLLSGVLVSAIALLMVMQERNLIVAANLTVASVAVVVLGEMLLNGGMSAPAAPLSMLIVPVAVFVARLRDVLVWTFFVLASIVGLAIFESHGLTLASELTPDQQLIDKTQTLLIGALISTGFIVTFSVQGSRAMAQLSEQRLAFKRQAMFDSLTGLPNRSNFHESASQSIESATVRDHPFKLVFLDINGFKAVNDGLGHDAGDQLLIELARRLELRFTPDAMVARLAGDEFVICSTQSEISDDTIESAVDALVVDPFLVSETELKLSLSYGIAHLGRDGLSLRELLSAADREMYAMKKAKRSAEIKSAESKDALSASKQLESHQPDQAYPRV